VLSGPAVANINASVLDELVVTNTIPLRSEAISCEKIRQLSIGELLAETMCRVSNEESVSSLFVD
jgi:ribose-phosphate pyrophosphokinase